MDRTITVYVGQREDCGCEITADEWTTYCALVSERVSNDYPGSDVEIVESHKPGHSGTGATVAGEDVTDASAERDVAETIQDVWEAGQFWIAESA